MVVRITRSVTVELLDSGVGVGEMEDDADGEDVVLIDCVGSASKTIGAVVCSIWSSGFLGSVSNTFVQHVRTKTYSF